MTNITTFSSESGNKYLYTKKNIYYLPPDFEKAINHQSVLKEDEYYLKKLQFLKKYDLLKNDNHDFTTEITPESIKRNLGNPKQFLIEVTDECNLACAYCGYRELYTNYDNRSGKKQTFKRVRLFLDYLTEIWKSPHNLSFENTIFIGFYGGEPLLNMKLIKQTVDYIEGLNVQNLKFIYNMTTNAMLLDKHMDFLHEKKFRLLISLDGNKTHHSYRVTKNGKKSFDTIFLNVKKMKDKYPRYFEEYVNFNAVLHNRSSHEEIYNFIYSEFGKVPRIAELSFAGVAEDKQEEFLEMYQSRHNDIKANFSTINKNDSTEALLNNKEIVLFDNFINSFVGNTYRNLSALFQHSGKQTYLPTGTCQPFQRKIFLTVNGKLLQCERVGQERPLGYVTNNDVIIDFETMANLYSGLYAKIVNLCKNCAIWNNCGQCMFLLKEKNNKLQCNGFLSTKYFLQYLSKNISLAESLPFLQEKLIEEIVID